VAGTHGPNSVWRRRSALAFLLAAGVGLRAAENGPLPAPLGVYLGNGASGAARLPAFTKWLGRPPDRVLDFLAYDSWASLESDAAWTCTSWRGSGPHPLVSAVTFSLPLTVSGTPLADVASGRHDQSFRTVGLALAANGWGGSIIRLGWEFNGAWMPWAAGRDPAAYVAAFRHVVVLLRSIPGTSFRFDWCCAWGRNAIAPDLVYPGDDVVDVVGMDVYTRYYNPLNADPGRRWGTYATLPYGLNWLASFSAAHRKGMSVPEWGTGEALTVDGGSGGGDDPLFVRNMAAFLAANRAVYSDYWDYHATDYDAAVSDGEHPKSGAALRLLFGPVRFQDGIAKGDGRTARRTKPPLGILSLPFE
jgi:hypothetical protein